MASIEVNVTELHSFFDKCNDAGAGDFKKELLLLLEGIGTDFLRILQDEIVSKGVVDTRTLLRSFRRGDENNVWILSTENLELEVGTNVSYAKHVNDGHWQNRRFVPGKWAGDRFIYDPGAKTGMMLTAKKIEGKHYWEGGIEAIENLIPNFLDAKIQQWLEQYFSR